ncbi:MAG: CoA transferase [Aquamicrobium sp.]|nr:CoA transferase [Aquamicrobium sp.]
MSARSARPVDTLPKPEPRPDRPLPLGTLRVVDFTRFLSGPWCTQTLADLGAEVIKIENPGIGDETRTFVPPEIAGESPYFLGVNRNKKSIALDLRAEAGLAVALDLVRGADILVQNFSDGAADRLGLSWDAVRAINPRLIYCTISGWGSGSALAGQPGFDSVFQAESGFASLTGDPDRLPMRTGTPIIDITASMNATIAILAALAVRDRLGIGQHVEVALYDTAVTLLAYFGMNYLASGKDYVRQGNTAPVATPIGMFACGDGKAIYVSCGTQRSWEQLAAGVLARPEWLTDPRFATHQARNRNQKELMALIGEVFTTAPRDHWMERVHREKVPAGAVRSVAETFASAVAGERRLATRLDHPSGEPVPNIASPFRFSETPVAAPVAAPRLDADRLHVLTDILGYDAARIATPDAGGAFGGRQL